MLKAIKTDPPPNLVEKVDAKINAESEARKPNEAVITAFFFRSSSKAVK